MSIVVATDLGPSPESEKLRCGRIKTLRSQMRASQGKNNDKGDCSMLRYAWYIYGFANSSRHATYKSVSSLLAAPG